MQVLKARLRQKTGFDTSYLFSGGHGQGKTTLARILARALLCQNLTEEEPCNECDNCRSILNETCPGFSEMDSASQGTTEVARGIVNDLPFLIPGVQKRIYLFDEAHRMSRDAQDVFLKPLEENRLIGIFCTTEPEKIRGPIRSRCEFYQIRKITREEILKRMKWVLGEEKVEYDDDAVLAVIDYSHGHVRDILKRLEMVAQLGPVTQDNVREYLKLSVVTTYYDILLSLGDPATSVRLIEEACEQVDPEDVATGLAEAAMNSFRLANNMHTDFSVLDRDRSKRVYDLYGAAVTSLADFFLQDYKPSRIGLVCSVVRCAKGVPTRGSSVTAPPIVVQAPVVETISVAPPSPTLQTSVEAAPPTPPQIAAAAPPSTPSAKTVLPLTELDDKAIPENLPRGSRAAVKPTTFKGTAQHEFLTPDEWKRTFETIYLHHTRGSQ